MYTQVWHTDFLNKESQGRTAIKTNNSCQNMELAAKIIVLILNKFK